MNTLESIIGLRGNVAVLLYEDYCGMRICIGGMYIISKDYILPLDSGNYNMNMKVKEFHWSANNLQIVV